MTAPADLKPPEGWGSGWGQGQGQGEARGWVGLGRRAWLKLTTHVLRNVLCRTLLHTAGAKNDRITPVRKSMHNDAAAAAHL